MPILTDAIMVSDNIPDVNTVVDNVDTATKLLSEYGPALVITGLFLILFIIFVLLMLRTNNKMIQSMMDQSENDKKFKDALISKVLNSEDDSDEKEKNNEETKPNKQKDLISIFINTNSVFGDASKKLINSLRCERTAIYVFHNGNYSVCGLPFIKMSCVHETTMMGTGTLRGKSHIDLPLHLFNDIIEKLYTQGEYTGSLAHSPISGNSLSQFVAYSNTKSLFMLAITKDDGTLVGFSVCEFSSETDFGDKETYDRIKNALDDFNNSIRYIILNEQFIKQFEH